MAIDLHIHSINSDGFEGYWDLIEKKGSDFVKQAQGEVTVDSTATPTF